MNAIVVVDEAWGIGKDGRLLVHLPGDLKYYREKTIGKIIVVGRKTLESFPEGKPLPDRTNIVITRNNEYEAPGCVICRSEKEALDQLKQYRSEDIFIAGGAEIYKQFMDRCDTFYVTKIYKRFDADRYFPNLDELGYQVLWESPLQVEKGMTYRFFKYGREA